MRIHVLGIGSIGTLLSHHLRIANPALPISLIVKHARQFKRSQTRLRPYGQPEVPEAVLEVERDGRKVQSGGYEIEIWHDGEFERQIIASEGPLALPGVSQHPGGLEGASRVRPLPNTDIDSLVVCLKAHSTTRTLSILAPRLRPTSVITLIQNGTGVYEELCKTIWPNPSKRPQFILGTTDHGVSPSPTRLNGAVLHRSAPGTGRIKFGLVPDPLKHVNFEDWLWGADVGSLPFLEPPPSPSLPLPETEPRLQTLHDTLTALLSLNQLNAELLPLPHLRHEQLVKVAINSIINPLTAILGAGALSNGQLVDYKSATPIMTQLARETSDAITAHLLAEAAPRDPSPEVMRIFSLRSLLSAARQLARRTRRNISSMAIDVTRARTTEIDYINGYIVSLGQKHKIATPSHEMVINMVRHTVNISGAGGTIKSNVLDKLDRLKDRRERLEVIQEAAQRSIPTSRIDWEQSKFIYHQSRVQLAQAELQEEVRARRRRAKNRANESLVQLKIRLDKAGRGDLLPTLGEWNKLSFQMKARVLKMAINKVGGTKGWKEASESSGSREEIKRLLDGLERQESARSGSEAVAASELDQRSTAEKLETLKDVSESVTADKSIRNGDGVQTSTSSPSLLDSTSVDDRTRATRGSQALDDTRHRAETSSFAQRDDSTFAPDTNSPPATTPPTSHDSSSGPPATTLSPIDDHTDSEGNPTFKSSVSTFSIDSLIASAPREERTWDVPSAPPTVRGPVPKKRVAPGTPPPGKPTPPSEVDTPIIPGLPTARAPGRMANWMDGMITSAPRQERTWDASRESAPTGKKDLRKASISYRQGS